MTSFKKLQDRQAEMIARLVEFSADIDVSLIENIVQYAKNLVQPDTNEITDNMFTEQMVTRFKITSQHMITQMFEVLQRRKSVFLGHKEQQAVVKSRSIRLEDYCVCMCIFLTNNINQKIDWVFSVYDANNDGILSKMELYLLLKPCVLHTDDIDSDEAIRDLIEIVMAVCDMNKNGSVDLEEFRAMVARDVLYIDVLGQCLPAEKVIARFIKLIKNKSPMEVGRMFQKERENGIMMLTSASEHSLYPVYLDLP